MKLVLDAVLLKVLTIITNIEVAVTFDSHPRPDATLIRATSSVWAVSNDPPTVTEVQKAMNCLQLKRAAGPDDLHSALFKNGNSNFINLLTNLFGGRNPVPLKLGRIPIFKTGKKTLCDNHRGISLTSVITKLLALIIL